MKKLLLPLLLLGLAACADKTEEKKGAPPVLVTVTEARAITLEVVERTLGSLEAVNDPKIGAEIAGRVAQVAVRAGQAVKKGQLLARLDPADANQQALADHSEAARVEALLAQQERLVVRQTELVQKNFISRNALDDAVAQRDALKNQLLAARARGALSGNNVTKTRVVAPFDGVVEEQLVAPGDYIKLGDPLFRVISNAHLRAHLPFPETVAPRLKPGLTVRLVSPLLPGQSIAGVIEDLRPSVSEGSRALDAIARISNPGALRGGGSVDAIVVVGKREGAVVVPEQSVVLRPAGKVVYVIADGKAAQRVIEVGDKQDGLIEVIKGVAAGETVALDGAGFLTQGAAVTIRPAAKAPAAPAVAVTPAKP